MKYASASLLTKLVSSGLPPLALSTSLVIPMPGYKLKIDGVCNQMTSLFKTEFKAKFHWKTPDHILELH